MRAIYLEQIGPGPVHVLQGEVCHHLVKVVRLGPGEDLLLLNGMGLVVKTKVVSISKKEIQLEQIDANFASRNYEMDLVLGIPKREALELSLKQATELGFRRIYLVRADYSQTKLPDMERLQRILVSALEQSNSPFLPQLIESNWESVPWQEHALNLLLDSQSIPGIQTPGRASGTSQLVVGPEGGFSPSELLYLHSRPQIEILTLPTPILRTPTAVAAGAGVLLQRLMD